MHVCDAQVDEVYVHVYEYEYEYRRVVYPSKRLLMFVCIFVLPFYLFPMHTVLI